MPTEQRQKLALGLFMPNCSNMPSISTHREAQARAHQQVPPAEVEQRQISSIVHVAQDVDICRQRRQANPRNARG